jgi:hypothetical protein
MRYLAPAVLSDYVGDVGLYWTATFVGSAIVAMIYRKTILSKSKMIQRKKSNLLSSRFNDNNNKSSIDRKSCHEIGV